MTRSMCTFPVSIPTERAPGRNPEQTTRPVTTGNAGENEE